MLYMSAPLVADRESDKSFHVLLNLFNGLGTSDKM